MSMREHAAVAAILGRRSIRKYTSQPVEREKIDLLLECACAAPTAAGSRPWHFVVVDDRAKLDALAGAHPYGKMLFRAPLAVVVCGDPDKNEFARVYWEEDCSAAMENILVAARALDLGSVWLGVHHSPEREQALRLILGIPGAVSVLGVAVLGYPDEVKEPHEGIDEGVVHRNGW
ncbi:nitroreductase family protein [Aminiphilus sp.]|jgi:nitroreductase|uniref:nitroreductase family protein n=1 Tax=Aminiphilus sp. TaxID=1872488 RepID=UPI00260EE46E|nr:nitroreductase family protein [Aminiphilus sp.]